MFSKVIFSLCVDYRFLLGFIPLSCNVRWLLANAEAGSIVFRVTSRIRKYLWPLVVSAGCLSLVVMLQYSSRFEFYQPVFKRPASLTEMSWSQYRLDASRKIPPLTESEVAARFEERRKILESACKNLSTSSDLRLLTSRLQTFGPYKPAMNTTTKYCLIQKTASTTWKKILKKVDDNMRKREIREQEASNGSADIVFAFVREPYSRLLSAYVDKLFSPNTLFWSITGRYIITHFRRNASQLSLRCGHDVTFAEYVRYFIHAQTTGEHRDGHFVPTHDHCRFCQENWTHIGHLETISEDMPYLLSRMQSQENLDRTFDNFTILNNSKMVLQLMQNNIGLCMDREQSMRRLWKKWHVRGIISKGVKFPLSREETRNITNNEFVQVALRALGGSGEKSVRSGQKREALREAFASVPLRDRVVVKRLLMLDFAMFGFDPAPDEVFPQKPYFTNTSHFSYFDLYM